MSIPIMAIQEQGSLLGRAPSITAAMTIAAATLVLSGWVFDLPALKSVFPGLVTMKVNAAFGFVLAGVSLWHVGRPCPMAVRRGVSLATALAALALGMLTLGEYLSGADYGIDQMLIRETTRLPGDIPGRMAIITAINFTLTGMALLLLHCDTRSILVPVHVLALLVAVIAGSGLVGYAYSIEELYRIRHVYSAMAVHTALLFLLLAFGIVNARPEFPFRRIMASDSTEVVTTRHLLFTAILLPFVIGWLLVHGYRAGYFGEAIGLSLFAVSTMAGFGVLVLRNTARVYEIDQLRQRAEEDLRAHEAQLEQVVALRTVELNRANEALEQQARFDFLTGMINRRYFMELANGEFLRARRYQATLSVLMLDVDHFKRVNDNHGHQAGDVLLASLAAIFEKTLREIDIVGRVGGEEFAIILPQTDGAEALEVAERLRQVIADAETALADGSYLKCTASIGIATLSSEDRAIDNLLHRADLALYRAKHSGRNRVCASPSDG